jgi:hypothetical protein
VSKGWGPEARSIYKFAGMHLTTLMQWKGNDLTSRTHLRQRDREHRCVGGPPESPRPRLTSSVLVQPLQRLLSLYASNVQALSSAPSTSAAQSCMGCLRRTPGISNSSNLDRAFPTRCCISISTVSSRHINLTRAVDVESACTLRPAISLSGSLRRPQLLNSSLHSHTSFLDPGAGLAFFSRFASE